jgi:LysM repeat protein
MVGLPLSALIALGLGIGLTGVLAVLLPSGTASAGTTVTVTVQPGESLSQVAAEENTTVAALVAANGITNPDLVDAGAVLVVPGAGPAAAAAPPPVAPAAAPTPTPTPAPAPAPADVTVTVQPGQTLSGLAAKYGTTAGALAAANGIEDPDLIVAGSVLKVPGPAGGAAAATPVAASPAAAAAAGFRTVEVQPGETLSALAVQNGTTVGALVAANGIGNPNRINAGTVLRLPGPAGGSPGTTAAAASVVTVGTVTVKVGDTLTSLAAHYGTTPGALAAANGIRNPNMIFAGMQLTLPAAAVVVAAPATAVPVATGAYPTALLSFPARMALVPDFGHAASVSGVPVSLVEAVCWWESGWQTTAVSPTGALGVCQILPSTAAFVSSSILQVASLDPRVAADNIDLCAAYLRYLLNSTGGNVSEALAGYSQGLSSIAQNGVLPSTKTYVTGILAYASIFAGDG